jgi:hypothetical protein
MAATTTNVTLGPVWTEVVADVGAYFWLSLPFTTRVTVEVLAWDTTDDVDNIDVQGHQLRGDRIESVNRSVLGEGYVYARCLEGTVTVVLST